MSLTLPAPVSHLPAATTSAPTGVTRAEAALAALVPAPAPAAPPGATGDAVPGTTQLDPLPLPVGRWGAEDALDALAEARLALPIPLRRPRVVSALTTVVLRSGQHAVKVYPPGTDPAHLARIGRALADTSTALLPVADPVVTSSGVVSVSPWLTDRRPVTWAEAGRLLAAFHAAHGRADVPAWDPLRRVVVLAADLPDEAAEVLLTARLELLAALAGLHSPLGVGVVHGDVSPANVMRGPHGPVLIDLDFVARAPREYDLTSAARRFEAGEIDAASYHGFCAGYGADVRSWDGRLVLDRIAQLGGVAFRIWDDRRGGRSLSWLDDAVRRWRTAL
jgi:Phosphotransferase enzyme family